jgi:SecD/SecF fusion protein
MAGAAGLGVVFLLFVCLYRLAGLLAANALAITILIVVAAVKLTAVVLTLSSLAGLTLAIALAAYAIVLILQRTREGVSTARGAADMGFVHAWPRIRILAATTVTTSIILWWAGSALSAGMLASFAAGLFIGATTSTVAVALASRPLV